MKKILFLALMLLLAIPSSVVAQKSSKSRLKQIEAELDSSTVINVSFTIVTQTDNAIYSTIKGTLIMSGDKFLIDTPTYKIGYDSEMQWCYMEDSDEVMLSTPDIDELAEINPYMLIKNVDARFTYKDIEKGKTETVIELKPIRGSDTIESALITVNNADNYPSNIQINNINNTITSIIVTKYSKGEMRDDSIFTFNEDSFKDCEIIDLR